MLGVVGVHLLVGSESIFESINDISLLDNVAGGYSVSCLESLFLDVLDKIYDATYRVCDVFETHFGGVIGSSLLGIADPEAYVVKAVEYTDSGLKLN